MATMKELFKKVDLNKISKSLSDLISGDAPKPTDADKPIILTEDRVQSLKWMSAEQLSVIFKHGKVKTHIPDDENVYRALKWMDQDQLEAIFGRDESL